MSDPATRARLDKYLLQVFRSGGRELRLAAGCIDTGGHHTSDVYQFSRDRLGRQVWGIKGASERSGQRSPVWPAKRPTKKHREKFRPFLIGTQAAKDAIWARLKDYEPNTSKPGLMHFPADRDFHWFSQLTAERLKTKVEGGRKFTVWEQIPGRANEALDCRVYAYAALQGLLAGGLKLNALAEQVGAWSPPETADEDEEIAAPVAAPMVRGAVASGRRRVVRSSYMGG